MDAETFRSVSAMHVASVLDVARLALSDNQWMQLDTCVFSYLITMLEGQTVAASFLPETVIVETLQTYFMEFGCFATADAAGTAARKIVTLMDAKGLAVKPKVSDGPSKLLAPVSMGREYEENVRRSNVFGGQKVVVNTNDEWTWDIKRDAAKNDRKRRKEEEKRAELQDEYEEFLRQRGVLNSRQIMKLHKDDRGGNASNAPQDIRSDSVTIRMGKNLLLNNANLVLNAGHKYGLIGRNGSGKTTLLRALAEGALEGVSPFIQILHVEQEISGGTETPLQCLLESDVERTSLLKEERTLLEDPSDAASVRLATIYERLDAIDAAAAEARASSILHGLSFSPEMMNMPTSGLSGGWRMRVALARALFVEPEVLLLDEPTNHLDLFAVLWLEQLLRDWPKTIVVVSHSRSFLNSVCTEIIHLDQQLLTYYTGNYDSFEITRSEQLRLQQRQHEAQEKKRDHMMSFVTRFRYNANRAKMAQSRLKALERMALVAPVLVDSTFSFTFPDPDEAPQPFIQIIDCEFGYSAGHPLFTDVNFSIDAESRIALVGANGAGKTTFMNVVLGKLEPRKGQVIRNPKVRVAHFSQHHLESLTPHLTPLEFMRSKFPAATEQAIRAHLGSLGITGDRALQPIYTLSGGQKSRVAFALITYTKPHLLLLDEPTNHLDMETVHALLEALLGFQGGVVVVSHDEHLITSLCDEIYLVGGGKMTRFEGDFAEYKANVAKSLRH